MSAVLDKPNRTAATVQTIEFHLDGKPVSAIPGETILQVAKREGVKIPHLCYKDGLEPVGNCRSCMVEVDGERVLAASCCRAPSAGMNVKSSSERAVASQKLVLELLMSDMPREQLGERDFGELSGWAGVMGVGAPRFAERAQPAQDLSHPAIAVNLDACIQCTRCLRACRDEQVNDVIGLAFRGAHAQIVFDQGDVMGQSTCVACGECVQACPTGALSSVIPKASRDAAGAAVVAPDMVADKVVDSLCPFCGVGCQVTYHVKDDKIIHVEGRDGPANDGRLCVKGRYGFDYAHHPQRLTTPLIRRADAPKTEDIILDADNWREVFREATWEEALDVAANGLKRIRDEIGPKALVGFGSAKGSNEEAYLFQKLVRTGFRSNNVDHCTRLCHASSVSALLEGIGSGAVSNPVRDVEFAEVVIIIGANPSVNHPVASSFIKNAVKNGTKLIVLDPRRGDLARLAWRHLAFKPDTDVALLNAMMHVIVEEGLTAPDFIAARTIGFDELKANLARYSPEEMAPVCGIDAATIREVARLYATSKASMILWGMGVSQHVHGTDNARCLIALSLMTGQIARPGTGLHPLRGQNNVQGASDAGLIPMMYPDYQRVDNADARAKFEKLWGMPLDPTPGLTVVEVMDAAYAGEVRGLYVMGENPAMSDPDANHARAALARLDHLVVQDIFLTETAAFADVVLPASAFAEKTGSFTNTDRLVQLGQAAVKPPGDARQDLWIIQQLAQRIGLDWNYADVGEVFDEMRRSMPSIAGITWQRLQHDGAVTYPCMKEGDPGDRVEFVNRFPTPTGKARFVPAGIIRADEQPDTDYPLVLITGRQLEHWHTGSMTRRSAALDAIEPDPVALMHPQDLQRLGILPGEVVTLQSRRGQVVLYARADEGSPPGTVFVPFCYAEAAINRLTNPKLDPFGKIPEFKFCAVRAMAGGELAEGLVGAN
ncbi:formate dehydrogenase subunit alpha [Piscinibacter sakaiensis]|uniref:formate dehydrogenase subunit alpha n=1 Tax=Piscinibacter sakaiensis TaxID=1547922 RepID=UPI003AADC3EC